MTFPFPFFSLFKETSKKKCWSRNGFTCLPPPYAKIFYSGDFEYYPEFLEVPYWQSLALSQVPLWYKTWIRKHAMWRHYFHSVISSIMTDKSRQRNTSFRSINLEIITRSTCICYQVLFLRSEVLITIPTTNVFHSWENICQTSITECI